MNERLEKLWYLACLSADGVELDSYEQEAIKKFAELIIRECMRMCDCADVSLLEHNRPQEASGAAGAKEIIKEWFGVEEQALETAELHTCPYAEEINGDYETLCDCDEARTRQCAADI